MWRYMYLSATIPSENSQACCKTSFCQAGLASLVQASIIYGATLSSLATDMSIWQACSSLKKLVIWINNSNFKLEQA